LYKDIYHLVNEIKKDEQLREKYPKNPEIYDGLE
jgi:hypothetical protein